MAHIISLEDGESRVKYVYLGPFDTFDLAGQWLEDRGFQSVKPNLWEKETPSRFYYLGHIITVPTLRAFVDCLHTPEKINFSLD